MNNTSKVALIVIGLLVAVSIALIGAAAGYYYSEQTTQPSMTGPSRVEYSPFPSPVATNSAQVSTPSGEVEGVFCTLDAKLCPDGSSVGRTGPNCEFAPCP